MESKPVFSKGYMCSSYRECLTGVKCVSGCKVRRGGVRAVVRANTNPLALGILRTSIFNGACGQLIWCMGGSGYRIVSSEEQIGCVVIDSAFRKADLVRRWLRV